LKNEKRFFFRIKFSWKAWEVKGVWELRKEKRKKQHNAENGARMVLGEH
jgi:hypothetical protein